MNLFPTQTIKTLLQNSNIDTLDAEILLGFTLKKPREFIVAHPEHKVSFFNNCKYRRLLKKRKQGWSVAYLLGKKEFFGLDFFVNKHTLIPRPETELIVELAIGEVKSLKSKVKSFTLIDVGTGSGCIPIAIVKALERQNIKKDFHVFATDISAPALKIAAKNAKKHNANIQFLHGNLLLPLINLTQKTKTWVITANLPYLTEEQFITEPSIQHEPKTTLVADNDGLALYEELLLQIKNLTETKDIDIVAFFEINPSQNSKITFTIKKYFPAAQIEIKKDLAGLDRVVCCQL